jgi:hypothetical protein
MSTPAELESEIAQLKTDLAVLREEFNHVIAAFFTNGQGSQLTLFNELGIERATLMAKEDSGGLHLRHGGHSGIVAAASERGASSPCITAKESSPKLSPATAGKTKTPLRRVKGFAARGTARRTTLDLACYLIPPPGSRRASWIRRPWYRVSNDPATDGQQPPGIHTLNGEAIDRVPQR